MLGNVGGCWELLVAGRRNKLLVDARVSNTQQSQNDAYKFKGNKILQ